MYYTPGRKRFSFLLKILLLFLFTSIHYCAYSQVATSVDSLKAKSLRADSIRIKQAAALSKQFDFGDLVREILHPNKAPDSTHKKPSAENLVMIQIRFCLWLQHQPQLLPRGSFIFMSIITFTPQVINGISRGILL